MSISIVIYEDNVKILEVFSILIGGVPEMELKGTYTTTANLLADLRLLKPDVVLMDIGIEPNDGIASTKQIVTHFPDIKVLIQTVFEDDHKVFSAICAGASGYILKSAPSSALLAAVTEVYEGGAPMTGIIARKVLVLFKNHFPSFALEEAYNLTPREKHVLRHLTEGLSYKMIAAQCEISYETVKTHIKSIYEKLHVASMTEAVAKAINEKLINKNR